MLNQDKRKEIEVILNNRKKDKLVFKRKQSKILFALLSLLLCVVIVFVVYICLDISNIYTIAIEGNIYLKDKDVIELSGLTTNDKYLFVVTSKIENKIKENEIIDTCKVEKLNNKLIRISVIEKKIIGYAYEDGLNVLIMSDNSRFVLDKNSLYLIDKVPLIEGFLKDDITLIGKELENVDYKMINEISEIHYYPLLKYQNHEIIMRDGNYIFTSVYGLKLLNKYYDIESSVASDTHKCYYFEDISGNAYISACPWQEVKDEVENKEN